VVVVRVDERAVDVENRYRRAHLGPHAWSLLAIRAR
jgi:hypothetical protein